MDWMEMETQVVYVFPSALIIIMWFGFCLYPSVPDILFHNKKPAWRRLHQLEQNMSRSKWNTRQVQLEHLKKEFSLIKLADPDSGRCAQNSHSSKSLFMDFKRQNEIWFVCWNWNWNGKMMPGVVGVVVVVPSPIVSVIVFRLHWVHGFGVVVVTKLVD